MIGLFCVHGAAELNAVVNKLMRAIRTAEFTHEGTLRITWSVGAVLASAEEDIDNLLRGQTPPVMKPKSKDATAPSLTLRGIPAQLMAAIIRT